MPETGECVGEREQYTHLEHGEMEWYSFDGFRKSGEGWRCTRCHVIAPPERADDVFDSHDCDDYHELRKGIGSGINGLVRTGSSEEDGDA